LERGFERAGEHFVGFELVIEGDIEDAAGGISQLFCCNGETPAAEVTRDGFADDRGEEALEVPGGVARVFRKFIHMDWLAEAVFEKIECALDLVDGFHESTRRDYRMCGRACLMICAKMRIGEHVGVAVDRRFVGNAKSRGSKIGDVAALELETKGWLQRVQRMEETAEAVLQKRCRGTAVHIRASGKRRPEQAQALQGGTKTRRDGAFGFGGHALRRTHAVAPAGTQLV
jgi:hypothetical protein